MYIGKANRPVIDKVIIELPGNINELLNAMDQRFPNLEYAIVSCGIWEDLNEFHVDNEEFYIPKQKVSLSFVDPMEDKGWNFVLHKHPDGIVRFSALDLESLTPNFDVSLLWVSKVFSDVSIRLKVVLDERKAVVILRKAIVRKTEETLDVERLLKEAQENIIPIAKIPNNDLANLEGDMELWKI